MAESAQVLDRHAGQIAERRLLSGIAVGLVELAALVPRSGFAWRIEAYHRLTTVDPVLPGFEGSPPALGLGNSADFGLVNVLNINVSSGKKVYWDRAVYEITGHNLHVLPSGHVEKNHYELLGSSRLNNVLDEAREYYDYVILDTPPVVYLADSKLIERWVDGLYLVGAGTHPGAGVPGVVNSAKATASLILEDFATLRGAA